MVPIYEKINPGIFPRIIQFNAKNTPTGISGRIDSKTIIKVETSIPK